MWRVEATYAAVVALMDHLRCEGIQRLVLESTSDYWRIWFFLVEAAGLAVQLVNAAQAKNLPGPPQNGPVNRTTGRNSAGQRTDGSPGGYGRGP